MSAPSSPSPSLGVPFGRYLIRTRLGRGGMGEVFLADQLGPLGPVRPVALKRLLPTHTDNTQVVQLFFEEMATAAQLSHPNIAVTYDFGEVEGVYFIAMEYVDGLPLDQLIRNLGCLPVPAVVAITQALSEALQYAHDRKAAGQPAPVVHQDVTPHNVIVSRDGQTKLLDFGIARTEAVAQQGRLRAKVRYAAPEQLRGAPPDRRFDVWGLGVTMYQALSGRLPFPQKEFGPRLAAAEAGRFIALGEAQPEAASLEHIIHKALHPDPQERFRSVESLCAAVLQVHPLSISEGQEHLSQLVAQVSSAPRHLDGGELTSTGVQVPAPITPSLPAPPPDGEFVDDGPTRVTRAHGAASPPAPAAPPRRPFAVVATGLLVGAALVTGLRLVTAPEAEAPVSQVKLQTEPALRVAEPPIGPPESAVTATRADGAQESAPPSRRAAAVVAAPPPPQKRAGARRVSHRRPAPRPAEVPAGPVVSERALGLVSVRTVPWARVFLDGQSVGEGVIARRPVAAGPHALRLEPGEGEHTAKTLSINVTPGETTRVFFDFETQELRIAP